MRILLGLAKPLLIGVLLLAAFERLNMAALYKDQDVLSTILEVEGRSTVPAEESKKQLERQITLCNAFLVATIVAIIGIVVYETKCPANQSK